MERPIRLVHLPGPEDENTRKPTFRNLSLNTKVVLISTSLPLFIYSASYTYRYLGGTFLYSYEYLVAVFGDGEHPLLGCFRFKFPKHLRSSDSWFQKQRCLGNELGLTRRGDAWRIWIDIVQDLLMPTTVPGFGSVYLINTR